MNTKYFNFNNSYNIHDINDCASYLMHGGTGIIPTDTVYGIGCDCLNLSALKRLYQFKSRSSAKPISILVSNISMVNRFTNSISPIQQRLMEAFWPGSLTIIFNKADYVPSLLTANLQTVGIRMPDNKICLDIINKLGSPIAMSSANISNSPPAVNIDNDLINTFNNKVDFIIDSKTINSGIPSTVVQVENNNIKIIREGSISLKNIMEVIQDVK